MDGIDLEDDMKAALEFDRRFLADRKFDALSPEAQQAATRELSLHWCSDKPAVEHVESQSLLVDDRAIEIRTYYPGADSGDRFILWVHGGGWIEGCLDGYDRLMRVLANCAKCAVVGVGYTKAPKAQFPAQLEELYAAIDHVDQHIFPQRNKRGIAGYSAGANLILSAFCKYNDEIGPRHFQRASFVCGVFDHNFRSQSYTNYDGAFGQSGVRMRRLLDAYAPGAVSRKDRVVFPIRTHHSVCNEFQILCAEHDALRDDSINLANSLRSQGKNVEFVQFERVSHIFIQRSMGVAAARRAIEKIGDYQSLSAPRRHTRATV